MSYTRLLLAFILVWFVALFEKGKLPPRDEILPALLNEPVQTAKSPETFSSTRKGETYQIEAVADYDLSGLVVSLHHSDWFDISHKDWKDYLNVADLCVVYGDNITSDSYRKVKFSHGDWTCYYSYSGSEGADFKGDYFSNNHILVDDPALEKEIMSVGKGDQIHFKGFLVNYKNLSNKYSRQTNLTRNGVGPHACKIVYIKEFEVLNRANPFWRFVYKVAPIGALGALACAVFL